MTGLLKKAVKHSMTLCEFVDLVKENYKFLEVEQQRSEEKQKRINELIAELASLLKPEPPKCPTLDIQKRAHTTTWITMYSLGLVDTSFYATKDINIGDIAFANLTLVGQNAFAQHYEDIIINGRGAVKVGNKPIEKIFNDAKVENKSFCEFANDIDENYKFWGER